MQQVTLISPTQPPLRFVPRLKMGKKTKVSPMISRTRKPDEMSLEEWQRLLRRRFGREQKFSLKKPNPSLSEFLVANPKSRKSYRVAVRGRKPGDNFCSCPDFSVNTLGTCKHIEFTLARLERNPATRRLLEAGHQPDFSELYLRYGLEREVIFKAGRRAPESLKKLAGRYFDSNGVLRSDCFARFDFFLKQASKSGYELRCYDDLLDFVACRRDQENLIRRIEALFAEGAKSPAFENLLKVPLYPYQREGALFAASAGRALIADEMGLGKTIQAIAAAEILSRVAGVARVLIVCPTSLKHQWKQEIEKFSGQSAEVIEGLLTGRKMRYGTDTFFKITNYDVIHRDGDFIRNWKPDLIILDEAQRIKNWKTRTAQSVKRLVSDYAIVLTGTPLENRLEELHSIVEFIDRFHLGPLFRFLADHQHLDEKGRVVGYRNLQKISQTLKPILLRRTKKEVLSELPGRMDKTFFVPMTPQQKRHHEENYETVCRIVSKWRRFGFLSETDQRILMIALQNMRMACNSTYLLDQSTDHGVKADETMTLLSEILEDPKTKIVIFSQWVRTHEILIRRLTAKKRGFVFFHGGLPGRERQKRIQQFKEDSRCRIFLSTDAGGLGLNLQNASVVINMDQPWNPAVLEQRVGRVHRMGQLWPVRVIHFVSENTIEHGMLNLLSFKKSLFSGVLDSGENEVFLGGTRLKKFMESVEQATGAVPRETMQESGRKETTVEMAQIAGRLPEAASIGSQAPKPSAGAVSQSGPDVLGEILSQGLVLADKLKELLSGAVKGSASPGNGGAGMEFLAFNRETGQMNITLPLPKPETAQKISQIMNVLIPLVEAWR